MIMSPRDQGAVLETGLELCNWVVRMKRRDRITSSSSAYFKVQSSNIRIMYISYIRGGDNTAFGIKYSEHFSRLSEHRLIVYT